MNAEDTQKTRQAIQRLRRKLTSALLDLDALEASLPPADQAPALPRFKNKYRQHMADNEASGSWRKPEELKKQGKGGARVRK